MARGNTIEGFAEALEDLEKMEESLDANWLKDRQAYYAGKHFVPTMKRNSKTVRFQKGNIISVTRSKKFAGPLGVRVGVINNDPDDFPDFSAQALASVIEYGTAERYRELKRAGIITGRVSTGSMPAAPFLRPAWDANVMKFIKDAEAAIEKRVMP